MIDLLYIHPGGGWVYENIPMGVPGLMNSVLCSKLGVYDEEVTDELISRAGIIAIDLQWYLSLPAFLKLARRIKMINPRCKIVCGGCTATVFAKTLAKFVDFVIVGDAEKPFPFLVDSLLENGNWKRVPNVVTRDFATE